MIEGCRETERGMMGGRVRGRGEEGQEVGA